MKLTKNRWYSVTGGCIIQEDQWYMRHKEIITKNDHIYSSQYILNGDLIENENDSYWGTMGML